MGKRNLLEAKGLFVFLFLAATVFFAVGLYAQEVDPEKVFRVEARDNLATVDVRDAEIADVLKEIEKGTGAKITIAKELTGKKVTTKFEDKDVEGALKEILRDSYYVLTFSHDPENKEKKYLKEVKAGGAAVGSSIVNGNVKSFDIAYGEGKEEVGSVNAGEGAITGPQSFAVDSKGYIYICDTVNKKIQIFSSSGTYLSTIPLEEGIFAQDIAIDKNGFIYIYDLLSRKLYQYNKNGRIVSSLAIDEGRLGGGGEMRIINNNIYRHACYSKERCGDFIIGRILSDNSLVGPSAEELRKDEESSGKQGISGRKYMTGLKRFEDNGCIEIKEQNRLASRIVGFPLKKFFAIEFLGEDSRENIYLKTDRGDENKKIISDIHKFDKNGNYVSTFQTLEVAPGDFLFWSVKEYSVSEDGSIYQFLPWQNKLTINIWSFGKNR